MYQQLKLFNCTVIFCVKLAGQRKVSKMLSLLFSYRETTHASICIAATPELMFKMLLTTSKSKRHIVQL